MVIYPGAEEAESESSFDIYCNVNGRLIVETVDFRLKVVKSSSQTALIPEDTHSDTPEDIPQKD